MYKLILYLPFRLVLVHRMKFQTREEAEQYKLGLPNGFEVVDENHPDIAKALPVPIRRSK